MTTLESAPLPVRAPSFAVILVGPNPLLSEALGPSLSRLAARILVEMEKYPSPSQASGLASKDCDAIIIDLDPDHELGLSIVEKICASNPNVTVIAYARTEDAQLLVKCMRAGARELLFEPVSQLTLAEVAMRASARRQAMAVKRPLGKSFLFWGAKGGAGTSTIAAAFAVSLAEETKEKVALVDLDLQLGSLSLLLNATPRFTISDAIRNIRRLDCDLLSGMLTAHPSGVQLLAASDRCEELPFADPREAITTILRLLQQEFPYLVIDGSTNRLIPEDYLRQGTSIYLVTQLDVPSLRNANRLVAHLVEELGAGDRVQVVLNRYSSSKSDISVEQAERSLNARIAWRVPNSYTEANEGLNTGKPIGSRPSSLGRAIRAMALKACGKAQEKPKSGWNPFR
jgi:pilus assembly protein CpaE